jgi:pimeloyl-ACP methyl ester carboxylesterase
MSRLIPLALIAFLTGCASNAQRIDRLAESAGLARARIESQGQDSVIYMKGAAATAERAFAIFLEGDGRPWHGTEPSADPTTRDPIALKLLLRTPLAGAYVTRPCYSELRAENCTSERWTSGRYSEQVIASMAGTIRETMRRAQAKQIVLVGYSGGGPLAVLIAERLDNVAGVVTIAANLDTDAWTASRHYLPLTRSLNPAKSDIPHPWPEIHLRGTRDTIVPPVTTDEYFRRYPAARQEIIDGYDHTCCWVDDWPDLWATAREKLSLQ